MTHPLVSICIPTYNGEQFIAEAIDSAITQTYPKLEIVVSDDASMDKTLEIIESYKNRTSIPIHIFHHEPSGIGSNWNHCIQRASGEFIKFLFQDDVLKPICIEKMVEVFEKDSSVAIVASKREFIVEPSFLNEDTKEWIELYEDLQHNLGLTNENGISILDSKLFKKETLFRSPLNKIGEPSTILFKKGLLNSIGFFREDLNQVLDYEFCYRVLKRNKIAIIENKLVKFRLHNKQATVKNKGNDIYSVDHKIYERIIFDNYFWYLSGSTKKRLLRKYNPFVNIFYSTIDLIKKKL